MEGTANPKEEFSSKFQKEMKEVITERRKIMKECLEVACDKNSCSVVNHQPEPQIEADSRTFWSQTIQKHQQYPVHISEDFKLRHKEMSLESLLLTATYEQGLFVPKGQLTSIIMCHPTDLVNQLKLSM